MEYPFKEVEFWKFCDKCKHKDVNEVKDPCNECLDEAANLHSTKPVCFEEK